MLGDSWGVGQVLWTMIWLTVFIIWISLLLHVFVDIFRSHDMGGGAKALWVIFVILMPYLGVFVYLIARGHKMAEHSVQDAQAQDAAMKAYVRDAAGTSPSEELAKLADLKERGVIDEAEFQKMKAKVVS
jgi:hypothetical protein